MSGVALGQFRLAAGRLVSAGQRERRELEGRLGLVLHVVYLIFTEGYAATGHHDLVRCDLVDEAIRLARILHRLMPGEPRVTGLLALVRAVATRKLDPAMSRRQARGLRGTMPA